MFTGIIEEIGKLRAVTRQGQAMVLTLEAKKVLEDVRLGDSIAVNGVCLTVVAFDAASFRVDVMPETYRKTTLKSLTPGAPVNLERAMAAGGRYGGHMVQGHVDAQGMIRERYAEDNAVVFRIEPRPSEALRYIAPTGSVTIDGISLTVVEAGDEHFTVSIIPHTLRETVLQHKHPGDAVNIECDVIAKYLERMAQYAASGGNGRSGRSGITLGYLAEHGFAD